MFFVQKLPERRRETCYYQDTSHAASVTFEDDFGTFHGKMVIRSFNFNMQIVMQGAEKDTSLKVRRIDF